MTDILKVYEDNSAVMSLQQGRWKLGDSFADLDFRHLANGKPIVTYNDDETAFTMPYRLLSKAVLYQHGFFGLIVADYTKPNVLQKSVPLAKGITIIQDHDMQADKWIGRVLEAKWSKSINGTDLPGLDGICEFAVDPKQDSPRAWVQRGIREGYLHGMSVSLWLDWHKSHPDMETYDFLKHMGEDINGETVRMVVENIHRYYETSVCIAGVDGHASPRRDVEQLALSDMGELPEGEQLASLSMQHGWTFRAAKPQVVIEEKLMKKEKDDVQKEEQPLETMPPVSKIMQEAINSEPQAVMTAMGVDETVDLDARMKEMQVQLEAQLSAKYDERLNSLQAELAETRQELTVKSEELAQTKEQLMTETEKREMTELKSQEHDLSVYYDRLKEQGMSASLDSLTIGDRDVSWVSFVMSLSEDWQQEYAKALLREYAEKSRVPQGIVADHAGKEDANVKSIQAFKTFMQDRGYQKHQMAEAIRAFNAEFPDLAGAHN